MTASSFYEVINLYLITQHYIPEGSNKLLLNYNDLYKFFLYFKVLGKPPFPYENKVK
jgi:hypothetical protein